SDFNPRNMNVVESNTEEFVQHFHRDSNLDNRPIQLGNKVYSKGLAIHSRTELTFDLDGAFRQFSAIVGMDDNVDGREGATVVIIEGDGKQLRKLEVAPKSAPQPVALNINNVQKLKIVVVSSDLLDLGRHVDLADAKVTK